MTRTLVSVGLLSAAAALAAPATAHAQYAQPVAVDSAGQPVAQPYLPPPPPSQQPVMYVDPNGQPLGAPPPGMVFVDQYGQPIAQPGPPMMMQPMPPPRPRVRQPARSRAIFGFSVNYLSFNASSFRQAATLWGYSGFNDATAYALDGGVHVLPYVLLGARVGFVSATGGTARFDGAQLEMNMTDVGIVARIGYPVAMRGGWMFFPGIQIEAGGASANTRLRGETQTAMIPRVGGNILFMFSSPHLGLSLRFGYSSAVWPNAGGRGVDLDLGGFSAGLGAEVRL